MKHFKKQYQSIAQVWKDLFNGCTIHWCNDSYKLYVEDAIPNNEFQRNHFTYNNGKILSVRCISNYFGSILDESEICKLYSYSNFKDFKVDDITYSLYWNDRNKELELTALLDIESVLSTYDRITNLEELLESKDADMWDENEVCEMLEELTGYKHITSDNSYNWSSEFSSDIYFSIMSTDDEWYYNSGYLVVRIHQGGDIRGNYSKCRIYKFNEDNAQAILDCSHFGVYFENEPDLDRYSIGYGTENLYKFNQDFHIYGVRNDGTILCKRKSDGKRFKAQLETGLIRYF